MGVGAGGRRLSGALGISCLGVGWMTQGRILVSHYRTIDAGATLSLQCLNS